MVDIHVFLQDPKLEALLARAYRGWKTQCRQLLWRLLPVLPRLLRKRKINWQDMFARTKDMHLPLEAEQGGLLYVAARAISARRIAEYGTSFGVSTLYLAAAVRDNGRGQVIKKDFSYAKLHPESLSTKFEQQRQHHCVLPETSARWSEELLSSSRRDATGDSCQLYGYGTHTSPSYVTSLIVGVRLP